MKAARPYHINFPYQYANGTYRDDNYEVVGHRDGPVVARYYFTDEATRQAALAAAEKLVAGETVRVLIGYTDGQYDVRRLDDLEYGDKPSDREYQAWVIKAGVDMPIAEWRRLERLWAVEGRWQQRLRELDELSHKQQERP